LKLGLWGLTPHAQECLVRLGSWLPFEKAVGELEFTLGVKVSEASARRGAEKSGAVYVDWQEKEVERLEREAPRSSEGAEKLLFSTDGAMVPIVGGKWKEVKTLLIGEIGKPVQEGGELVVHSQKHSYFSRLMEADEFQRLSLVETQRRGLEGAKMVAAVNDGAEWEQRMIDYHCPQAVRILDFSHADERIWEVGEAVWGEDSEPTQEWAREQTHTFKHDGPTEVLAELQGLQQQHPTLEILETNLAYLEKRLDLMQYPIFTQQGLPIGSGAIESGNKLVVEARLKGAGMHWALQNVNPRLGLRNILCSGRWETDWKQIASGLRQVQCAQRQALHSKHQAARQALNTLQQPPTPLLLPSPVPPPRSHASLPQPPSQENHRPKTSTPAPNHPWRRSPIGKARYWPADHFAKN
jgi:hypothetical protein